ncbi:hypothetical protein VHUM_00334 [Vanrija humicola]|uniref:Uncharacterized protein n=1 Tax=Vanrija humicola TaxID=5417 RepID=A0A7D8VCN4_VANHU|nr:hypothetical protein VHUM_00334 [Vanrija humicola]
MFASAARRSLSGLIPPKIATPGAVSSGTTSARTQAVIDFYSKLPKGAAQPSGGLRGRYFEGKNASGKPIVATIGALFLIGYTIDYQSALLWRCFGVSWLTFAPSDLLDLVTTCTLARLFFQPHSAPQAPQGELNRTLRETTADTTQNGAH